MCAFGGLAFDQFTKHLFFHDPLPVDHFVIVAGMIEQVTHRNFGITANLPVPLWGIIAVTSLAIVLIVWMMFVKSKERKVVPLVFLGILLGGAMGNLVDRIWLGFVRDWLLLFGRSAVNVADGLIVIGFVGVIFFSSPKRGSPPSSLRSLKSEDPA